MVDIDQSLDIQVGKKLLDQKGETWLSLRPKSPNINKIYKFKQRVYGVLGILMQVLLQLYEFKYIDSVVEGWFRDLLQ